tara:strand:- start:510 stop:662 length:153 start_codon:yes stop_codon:yes gene_type:complete
LCFALFSELSWGGDFQKRLNAHQNNDSETVLCEGTLLSEGAMQKLKVIWV